MEADFARRKIDLDEANKLLQLRDRELERTRANAQVSRTPDESRKRSQQSGMLMCSVDLLHIARCFVFTARWHKFLEPCALVFKIRVMCQRSTV